MVRLKDGYVHVRNEKDRGLFCVIPHKVARDLDMRPGDVINIKVDNCLGDRAEIILVEQPR